MNQKHNFEVLNYEKVKIDEKMVPLIKKLWSLNIRTFSCCQELPANAVIMKLLKFKEKYAYVRV